MVYIGKKPNLQLQAVQAAFFDTQQQHCIGGIYGYTANTACFTQSTDLQRGEDVLTVKKKPRGWESLNPVSLSEVQEWIIAPPFSEE